MERHTRLILFFGAYTVHSGRVGNYYCTRHRSFMVDGGENSARFEPPVHDKQTKKKIQISNDRLKNKQMTSAGEIRGYSAFKLPKTTFNDLFIRILVFLWIRGNRESNLRTKFRLGEETISVPGFHL